MTRDRRSRQGLILITALWTLTFLTLLAVGLGLGVRQKIFLLKRVEDRAAVQLAAEAGIKKSVSVLLQELEAVQYLYTGPFKFRVFNDPANFQDIIVGEMKTSVINAYDETGTLVSERYGLCDEQGKINLNVASPEVIQRMVQIATGMKEENAKALASYIVDWRDYGRREAEGFFSDDYYQGLEKSYPMKERPFERIDELLLVRGVSLTIYEQLLPFVTVWGDGRVNVNTVGPSVLNALGLPMESAAKIIKARAGQDGKEATGDDFVFYRTFDVAAEVNALVGLDVKEMWQIDALNAQGILCTDSLFYSIDSRVAGPDGDRKRGIRAVFRLPDNKYVYWSEK